MFDQMFRRRVHAIDTEKQDLYTKLRVLGANVDKLKQLGLAIPELEQLHERLERVHDKALVRFITEVARIRQPVEKHASNASSRNVLKTCPRCTRQLTGTNVIKDHHSDAFAIFVLVCECGYVREIVNSAIESAARQSSLYEYPFYIRNMALNNRKKIKNNF
jgi:hypothetical protein